jgi:hypothetical protein
MTHYGLWPHDSTFSTLRRSRIHHNFHLHPLMQLDELERLAQELVPLSQCRFLKPNTTQSSAFMHDDKSHDGRTIADVFKRIEEPGSWVALYNVEAIPRYRRFLADVLDVAAPLFRSEQPDIFMITGFIFLSAPPSVTPFHIDRENNFWLQLRGRKTINVWDNDDRDVVGAEEVEKFVLFRDLGGVKLREEMRARSLELDAGPGDGMYFPTTSPHMTKSDASWVKPGDGVSISIGVNFYSEVTRRRARVLGANSILRRIGLRPRPPGKSAVVDAVKAPLGRAWIEARKRLRGYEPPPGVF